MKRCFAAGRAADIDRLDEGLVKAADAD